MNTTYRTPQQQLWEHLTESQRDRFSQILKRIKHRDQEDLCYGLLAFLKYGIVRSFKSPFMQTLFLGLIDLLENRSKKAKSNNSKNNEA